MNYKMHFHNDYHYGDCLFSLHFLEKISRSNNIECDFYCKDEYSYQLQEFLPKNSKVSLSKQKKENSKHLWMGAYFEKAHKKAPKSSLMCGKQPTYEDIYKILLVIFQIQCEELNLNCPFNCSEELVFDEEPLSHNITDIRFEYLLINSYCLSGQVKYSPRQQDLIFLEIIKNIKKSKKSFITTKKILDNPCTLDFNLSLVKIGQLSKNCKIILGVPTSPFLMCLNKFSLKGFDKIINITHDNFTFDFDNRFETINSFNVPILDQEWSEINNNNW